ncbi:alanine dehydrogenase [Actinoplanes sp. NBRC 14428]|uniref:proton-translocating NAD(P)(+) transhydrogenase n=1 Tax=Pseudosporangium ferrugineum TaxID=439699 RepID=A0A2T0SG43_9ACTN|nr:NAD(P) transhydrogenase subunit alpha [Pseudosporangium ferrugineum]PRY32379.1 NAD(P) transhydrogenase subunit alpha [Pseudosporangium ferrugineum]BCJ49372.1 alanine dehydrogenase [Actinoplanes sp. NBRC 14428]
MTTIGVPREAAGGERRVALVPSDVPRLRRIGLDVLVEAGAGAGAWHDDAAYEAAGATVTTHPLLYAGSDVIAGIGPPEDAGALRAGQLLVGLLAPRGRPALVRALAAAGVTAVSLDLLPRTLSRAQAMDALTSQASVAGYKAALVAADAYGGYLPMLMTAAGTTRPARVLVLGAGIAGLQAIATTRRLGAAVTGYDVREAACEDIASTGADVLRLGTPAATGEGGYARALTADEADRQQRALDEAVAGFDIVITTAQVPDGRPPVLVTAAALAALRPGSVVVDAAAGPHGGNVDGSRPGGTVRTDRGVTVIGAGNLAAQVPQAASAAYSRNLCALLAALIRDGVPALDPADEIHAAVVVTRDGEVVHPRVREALDQEVTS